MQQPALLAGGTDHVADQQRASRLASSRAHRRQVGQLDLATALVEHVEQRHQLTRAGGDHLVRRAQAEQPRRSFVGEHEPAGGIPDEHGFGQVLERRLEPLLEAADGGRQPCIVERESEARRQDLGEAQIGPLVVASGGPHAAGQRPHGAPASPERHEHGRAQLERPQERQVRVVGGDGPQVVVGHPLDQLALGAGQGLRQADRCLGHGTPARQRLLELRTPRSLHPRADPAELPARRDRVERGHVGERGHHELEQARHRLPEQHAALGDLVDGGQQREPVSLSP